MKVLLLGSGGREHALAWKIAQSSILDELFIAPGNAGTKKHGKNVDLAPTDFDSIKEFVITQQIDMVIVGPEEPLVNGIYDYFQADDQLRKVAVIGPSNSKIWNFYGGDHYSRVGILVINERAICIKSGWTSCRKRRFDSFGP